MADYKEEYIPDFLEYCEIVKLKPTVRDQIIFMAGMTSQSLKQQHLTTASTGQPDKPSASQANDYYETEDDLRRGQ